jgi:hypothetical protein
MITLVASNGYGDKITLNFEQGELYSAFIYAHSLRNTSGIITMKLDGGWDGYHLEGKTSRIFQCVLWKSVHERNLNGEM